MYDLIVIGGGPAGSAAAITATRAGFHVLLLERGRFPRHKVCGEFVSAESLSLLASLVADDAPSARLLAESPRIARGRLFIDNSILEAPIDPPAASITRFALDAALWRAAEQSGVEARQQATVDMVRRDLHFMVKTSSGSFEARAAINASGRWSNLSNRGPESANRTQVKWLGLKAHFSESAVAHSVDLYFFPGGYCGVQPVPADGNTGGRVNVCAMVRADVASSLSEVFSRQPQLRKRSERWTQTTEPVATSPLIFREPNPEKDGVALAGDAAGFVDPFVGDGISLALRSGVLAAESLMQFLSGKVSQESAINLYVQSYNQRLAPVFRNSSKIRRLFSLPRPVRAGLLLLFDNAPALTRYLVGKTR